MNLFGNSYATNISFFIIKGNDSELFFVCKNSADYLEISILMKNGNFIDNQKCDYSNVMKFENPLEAANYIEDNLL